jgi:hypothetical protein
VNAPATPLPTLTYKDLRSYGPCYDPAERGYCTPDWTGNALDILRNEAVPANDRLWLVCRAELIDARTLRLFAVWCARQALALVDDPDPLSVAACDVAERYANGEATAEELSAAGGAAWYAAREAAGYAAREAAGSAAGEAALSAAGSAAGSAAWSAAGSAAWYAAGSATGSATGSAAWSAAWSAAGSAREAALSAAWYAARYAEWSAQIEHLIGMLEGGAK